MQKFSIDYNELQNKLNQKKAYLLDHVKDRVVKVAFDVVRFVDTDDLDKLWSIHKDGDKEYIIAMYDDNQLVSEATKTASVKEWSVIVDGRKETATVFKNNNAVCKLSLASLNIPVNEAYLLSEWLPKKLASDPTFAEKLLKFQG